MKKILFSITIAVILAVLGACSNPAAGSGTDTYELTGDQVDFLKSLGVNTTLEKRLNAYGLEYPVQYNPMRKTLNAIPEAYTAGINYDSSGLNGNLRRYSGNMINLTTSFAEDPDTFPADRPMISVASDIDNDGYEEIITAENQIANDGSGGAIHLYISKYDENHLIINRVEVWAKSYSYNYTNDTFKNALSIAEVTDGSSFLKWKPIGLTAADVDGDGIDEVVLAWAPDLYILKIPSIGNNSATLLKTKNFPNAGVIMVAAADYMQDGKDEIALTISTPTNDAHAQARFELYDGNLNQLFSHDTDGAIVNIACYDVNNDGVPDTLLWRGITGLSSSPSVLGYSYSSIYVIKTLPNKTTHKPEFNSADFGGNSPAKYFDYIPAFLTATINDRGYIFADAGGCIIPTDVGNWIGFRQGYDSVSLYRTNHHSYYGNAVAGDFDGDGNEEIFAYLYLDKSIYEISPGLGGNPPKTQYAYYNQYNPNGSPWGNSSSSSAPVDVLTDSPTKVSVMSASVCAANVDNMGPVQQDKFTAALEYIGRETLFTDPQVLAVLISPPFYEESSNRNGGTALGRSVASGTDQSHAFGVIVGGSVTGKVGVPFIAEAKVSVAVEAGFHAGWQTSYEYTETVTDKIGTGEDLVIFTAVAYDVYYYKVLSGANMDDGMDAGDIIAVSSPNKRPEIYRLEREYYNSKMKDDSYKIPTTAEFGLASKIGNPFSYPDPALASQIKETVKAKRKSDAGVYSAVYRTVGYTDNGSTIENIQDVLGSSTTYDWSGSIQTSTTIEGGVLFATVELETHVKFEYQGNISYSVKTGTIIEGEVPDISLDLADKKDMFKWSLLAFPVDDIKLDADNKVQYAQSYTVVTYCVDPIL